MIGCNNVSVKFGTRTLFDEVNIKFVNGNCYGLIGANGAGKSTFLKVLAGDIEATTGDVYQNNNETLYMLRQDQFAYDEHVVLQTVLMGNQALWNCMQEKDAIYMKEDFSEEDGMKAAELEGLFAELDGWNAESNAASLLNGLGVSTEFHEVYMKELTPSQKVKVLLAQALFATPDTLLLDEPTNNLDIKAIAWLENFLVNYEKTVIVVSHDRHFLNKVCTHTADIDFGKIRIYAGNYDFWYESSQLVAKQLADSNKKKEEKIKELEEFVRRFSANASKSKQATSRKKILDKIVLDDLAVSNRKYPFINFKPERASGRQILNVENLMLEVDGEVMFKNVSFTMMNDDKVALLGDPLKTSYLLKVLAGELEPTSGKIEVGQTITSSYIPNDNSSYFGGKESIVEWLSQYTSVDDIGFVRGFLGRMLFSGEEALKSVNVLSGGEKARCMLSKAMLEAPNLLLLDDPTNHLDLESITALNNGLISYNSELLFTSHDHQFIQTIANRIIDLREDGIIDRRSTYDDYLASEYNLQD
ncbi:MAG: ATP-binding cassette domain-containing protein [Erysipelotrichaceae bacterium]